jgi:hypothetical protein
MQTMKLINVLAAISVTAMLASTATASLIINGSFESPDITGAVNGASANPTGWTVVTAGSPVDADRFLIDEPTFNSVNLTGGTGDQYVLFETDSNSELYGYAINLGTRSGPLTGSVDIAFWQDSGSTFARSDRVEYGFYSDSGLTTSLGTLVTRDLAADNVSANQFFNYGDASYAATGSEGDIYFGFLTTSESAGRQRTAFDNAVVAIPEPSALGLLGLGLTLTVVFSRRRRRVGER